VNSPKIENKLNKHLSKLYTIHACEISSEGQVAKDIDIPSTRISDLKGGRRHLSQEQGDTLREIYGLPNASSAIYLEAEYCTSGELNEVLMNQSKTIKLSELAEFFSSNEFKDELLSNIYLLKPEQLVGYVHVGFGKKEQEDIELREENERIMNEAKLDSFNDFISSTDFEKWVSLVKPIIARGIKKQGINALVFIDSRAEINRNDKINFTENHALNTHISVYEGGFMFVNKSDATDLIGMILHFYEVKKRLENNFANTLPPSKLFNLGTTCNITKIEKLRSDFTIVGKVVWETGEVCDQGLPRQIRPNGIMKWEENSLTIGLRTYQPNTLSNYRARLIYTEQYDYYLEIALAEYIEVEDRNLLIPISNRLNVFEELKEIFDGIGEDNLNIKSIKESIAKNGGYIPNSTYLN
jgi:hypothetical protein